MRNFYKLINGIALAGLAAMPAGAFAQSMLDVNVVPAPGFVKDAIETVTLTFADAESISFSSRALNYYDPSESVDKTGVIYFGGDEISQSPNMYKAEAIGNSVIFTTNTDPENLWTPKGKYQLMVPAGAIILNMKDGSVNKTWSCDYSFYYDGEGMNPILSITKGKVDEMSVLTIELPEGYEFSGGYAFSMYYPCIYGATSDGVRDYNEKYAYYKLLNGPIAGKTKLEYGELTTFTYPATTFEPVTDKNYCLYVPTSSLKIKNNATGLVFQNLPIEVPFTYVEENDVPTSVIENITVNDEVVNVYTITGVRVVVNGTTDDFDNLPAGLYIVNGKKVCKM